jgi:hypothetical protein
VPAFETCEQKPQYLPGLTPAAARQPVVVSQGDVLFKEASAVVARRARLPMILGSIVLVVYFFGWICDRKR